MSIIDFLVAPGIVLGCIVGIGMAWVLHWLFPDQDLIFVQALLVVGGGVIGAILEGKLTDSDSG